MTQRAIITEPDHWTGPLIEEGSRVAVEINGVIYTELVKDIDTDAVVNGRRCTVITVEQPDPIESRIDRMIDSSVILRKLLR